jgi:hypothetical protein
VLMPSGRHNSIMNFERITLRRAGTDDAGALATLAELDSQRLPDDEFLIGEVAGEPWAALGIASGILLADPYRPTVELAGLLRIRAESMGSASATRTQGRWLDAPRPLPCD